MRASPLHVVGTARWMLVVPVVAALLGCRDSPRSLPFDKGVAQSSLAACLDAWKSGKKPADLKALAPPIICNDPDWEKGKQLVRYEMVNKDKEIGHNLYPVVKLILKDKDGRESQAEIGYVVGTAPTITVVRQ